MPSTQIDRLVDSIFEMEASARADRLHWPPVSRRAREKDPARVCASAPIRPSLRMKSRGTAMLRRGLTHLI